MASKEQYVAIAVGFETIPYRKQISEEEIQKMQHDHTVKLLDSDKKETELKAINDEKRGVIKTLREEAKVLRNLIATKAVTMDVEAALVPDHDTGFMNYVNMENDEIVYSRRLTPDEKQLRENRLLKIG